jgi:hypothetical protein
LEQTEGKWGIFTAALQILCVDSEVWGLQYMTTQPEYHSSSSIPHAAKKRK